MSLLGEAPTRPPISPKHLCIQTSHQSTHGLRDIVYIQYNDLLPPLLTSVSSGLFLKPPLSYNVPNTELIDHLGGTPLQVNTMTPFSEMKKLRLRELDNFPEDIHLVNGNVGFE